MSRLYWLGFAVFAVGSALSTPAASVDAEVAIAYGLLLRSSEQISLIEPSATAFQKAEVCCDSKKGFGYLLQAKSREVPFTHSFTLTLPPLDNKCETRVSREAEETGTKYVFLHLDENDPPGQYRLQIYVNGALLRDLTFLVAD